MSAVESARDWRFLFQHFKKKEREGACSGSAPTSERDEAFWCADTAAEFLWCDIFYSCEVRLHVLQWVGST